MQTLNNTTEAAPINAIIGSNNQNVTFYNTDQTLLLENAFLKQENERLRGMLNLAISQLCLKDRLIKIFSIKWNAS